MKQFGTGAVSQIKNLWKVLVLLYLPIILLFLSVGVLSRVVKGASLAFFLRDITATGKLPFFAGFVSQLGGMLWSAALTVCFFALVVMRQRTSNFASSKRFLLQGGILTGLLLLDDMFLFHEEVVPEYLHLSEKVVFAGYIIVGIMFVFSNWNEILSSEYILLMIALAMFAASIVLDALPLEDFHVRYFWEQLELFLEDGFKFAGIATWLIYFARYTINRFQAMQRKSDPPQE